VCGIAGGRGHGRERLRAACDALAHRGPDASGTAVENGVGLAHTRLAIRDPDPRSDQPYHYGSTTLVYNGELWNAEQVRAELAAAGLGFATPGDTEVVAAALDHWGEAALERLDGMWAMAWVRDGVLRLATDRYGEIPLHVTPDATFASERKALPALGRRAAAGEHLGPGRLVVAGQGEVRTRRWYTPPALPVDTDAERAAKELRARLEHAVAVRTASDVPIACLLSGGLDSALTLALLRPLLPGVVAYTAVYDERSPDLRCARRLAADLGVELVEVPVPPPTPDGLARAVEAVEQPHKAQVEIGWACLALAARLRSDGARVVYSGEGSDELWASYGFAYHGIARMGWHPYRAHLFAEQHRKNFARVNKVFLAHGVEPRMPFLDRGVVELALGLPRDVVAEGSRPKAVLEHAAEGLLPDYVTRRSKLAFQDGLGLKAAAALAVRDPARFYRAEYARRFR